jgi:DNA-binding protein HU-beta
MNKSELIDAMAKNAGLTKVDSRKAYDGFVKAISTAMKKGEKVTLIGFGSFSVTKRAARTGVNPFTHKPMKIAAKKVVKFKPSKGMKA